MRYLLSKQKEFYLLEAAYSGQLVRVSALVEENIQAGGLGAIGYFPRITVGDQDYMLSTVVIGTIQMATTPTGESEITIDGRPDILRKWSILPSDSIDSPTQDMIELTQELLDGRGVTKTIFVPTIN